MKIFPLEEPRVDHSSPLSELSRLASTGRWGFMAYLKTFSFVSLEIQEYWTISAEPETRKHILLPKIGERQENAVLSSCWLHPSAALAFAWLKHPVKVIEV